jgi:hypothetical protein
MAEKTVDGYIQSLDGWKADVVTEVRRIVRATAPEARESIKWAQPVYESNGPFAYVKAFKNSVNFGFWRGIELEDSQGLLQGTGDKMRHLRLMGVDDIQAEVFSDFVRQAVRLNEEKGDPTKG